MFLMKYHCLHTPSNEMVATSQCMLFGQTLVTSIHFSGHETSGFHQLYQQIHLLSLINGSASLTYQRFIKHESGRGYLNSFVYYLYVILAHCSFPI